MGQIITFYSYKGGAGRSMALVNTACLLAQRSQGKVLMIDWDLEAPGLLNYFGPYLENSSPQIGLLEFMERCQRKIKRKTLKENPAIFHSLFESLKDYLIPINLPRSTAQLYLLPAGELNDSFPERHQKFDWHGLFKKAPYFFSAFAQYLSEQFEYVCIDSRTGFTDTGGICTMVLPEKLVCVFTPNNQSLQGVLALSHRATQYRINSDDLRPLMIYPLPSRIELEEEELKHAWKTTYKNEFKQLFQEVYGLPNSISLDTYFDNVMIRHVSRYAYGEEIAVLEEQDPDRYSLEEAYRSFCVQLTDVECIWEDKPFHQVIRPFEVGFIFSQKNQPEMNQLLTWLKPMKKDRVINWEDTTILPFEKWDETNASRLLQERGGYDLIFTILSGTLNEQVNGNNDNTQTFSQELQYALSHGNGKFIPILADDFPWENLMQNKTSILPHKKRPLSSWSDPDEAWERVMDKVQQILLDKVEENG